MEDVHKKLGDAGPGSLLNIRVSATTLGSFITARYNTKFAKGSAIETFSWVRRNGALKLRAYDIRSDVLVTN